jgi:protease II
MDGKRGVYAVPNLRAAENMEKNGMMQELKCKSKMYFDFIAAAEYLIAQKYTSSDFLPFVVVKWRFTSRSYYDSVQN